MDLFDQGPIKIIEGNEGTLEYIEDFLSPSEADRFFEKINRETMWERPSIRYFNKTFPIPRDTAWYGEKSYIYSGIENKPHKMTETLNHLRKIAEEKCFYNFNSLLINRYKNGEDKVGWHADDEPELQNCKIIASISLGEERDFKIRRKKLYRRPEDEVLKKTLNHGSLLIMKAPLQKFWEHEIPKRRNASSRINLTFRNVL
ncbi:alpha-ketoglutarate-dependent dioxygenase AlkB [Acinetobacter sp.]|uniref:alpha-ketoglutarate-dependent dioxygenase AlkB family protein n=1 Tax=Acinetobacter sp. TaxID=472 RepID=UPI000C3E2F11|nr:alpha-ketoglutarate-dependent dioxygenase AlkB [Acinetobacter sp.]MBC69840.1 alpha-ketoglutarate-dependent dioxygenase AlkB [Acinetobacter sp.]|tara:strand:- start:2032 stop:2637 length:606 start_codon:yes stop_codon:yes gene_type:complete